MTKSINLARVSLSPKYLIWLIVAIIVFIACWKVAEWVFGKVSGVAKTQTAGFISV